MDKFDSTPPSLTLSPAPVSEPESIRRLVVLVPDLEWDYIPGLLQKPLNQILESNLTVPVYVVSGVHIPKPTSNWLAQVTAWLGSIGLIAGFGLLQIKIMQVPEGWFQNVLLILVVIFEIWLIWVWDSWFG